MLTVQKSHLMTERELDAYVYMGAKSTDFRNFRESLGDDVINHIGEHPDWDYFTPAFKANIAHAIGEIIDEYLNKELLWTK